MVSLEKQYPDDESLIAKEEIQSENLNSLNNFFEKKYQKESGISAIKQNVVKKENTAVWMLTTYPPKECGIATFSQDLQQSVARVYGNSIQIKIAAIDNENGERNYHGKVAYIFNTSDENNYRRFAGIINNTPTKALIVQHEFGLFPEKNHQNFLDMLARIKKPVLMVMHTVIPSPAAMHRNKTINLIGAADLVIVMTRRSAEILQADYHIPSEKIEIIPHGTHLTGHFQKDILKEKLDLKNRTVLSTFGLISRNKNIETSLKALPSVIKNFPNVIFLVLGRIHPEVLRTEGESYLLELHRLVKDLQLENHVKFVNHYLSLSELIKYLQATDIYLFTSKDPAQAVSGTFSYALSAGCAIVSTPIPHAKELLENGSGLLFEFEDPQSLSLQILQYLNYPSFREKVSRNALELMAGTAWENTAIRYIASLQKAGIDSSCIEYKIPVINPEHLEKLTTETGIIQFARHNLPDPSSGYTLDDNSRALIAMAMLYRKTGSGKILRLIKLYLQFINDCQLASGSFINYRNQSGAPSSQNNNVNLEDSNGRAIWALGYIISMKKMLPLDLAKQAEKILQKAIPNMELIQSPRSIAFVIKGLYYYYLTNPSSQLIHLIENMADKLAALFQHTADEDWKWFEPYFTYANSILPEAMLIAYHVTFKNVYEEIAKESFDFLLSKIFTPKYIKVIPNNGWLHKGQDSWKYGEQPIDVAYTILALERFYATYKEESYKLKIKMAFNWFLGQNHLNRIIYNPATGGCFDGLEECSVNLNQGAESTVSYLLSRLTVDKYYEEKKQGLQLRKAFLEYDLFQ